MIFPESLPNQVDGDKQGDDAIDSKEDVPAEVSKSETEEESPKTYSLDDRIFSRVQSRIDVILSNVHRFEFQLSQEDLQQALNQIVQYINKLTPIEDHYHIDMFDKLNLEMPYSPNPYFNVGARLSNDRGDFAAFNGTFTLAGGLTKATSERGVKAVKKIRTR